MFMNGKTRDCLLFMHCDAPCPSQEGLRPKFTAKPHKSELLDLLQVKAVTWKTCPATTLLLTSRRLGRFLPHEPCSHTRDKKARPHPGSGDELLTATCLALISWAASPLLVRLPSASAAQSRVWCWCDFAVWGQRG